MPSCKQLPNHPTKPQRGFTLIELSIVLVIIGLVAGGVMVGQDLVRTARLQKVATDFQTFETQVMAFRNKYNCYPGDCRVGYSLFGDACGANSTGGWNSCNGNGNDRVENPTEQQLFWEHLSRSGLIEGSYDANTGYVAGVTQPVGPFPASQYEVRANISPSWAGINLQRGIVVYINGLGDYSSGSRSTVLTPNMAYQLDVKLDDGVPLQGKLISGGWGGASGCLVSGNGNYVLTSNNNGCASFYTIVY